MTSPVAFGPSPSDPALLTELTADAARVERGDLQAALRLASDWGARLPRPGTGSTTLLWEALASLAAHDLQVARAVEPHLDALAILDEHGGVAPEPSSTWGVYAAEGPGVRLGARPAAGADRWTLSGTKPWCSLADQVSHALVTAWVDEERRGLFAVDLRQDGVRPGTGEWVARGLPDVRSTSLELADADSGAVGGPGWYLERDGFAWGGIGVAAVWFGGAVGVARQLLVQAATRSPDQIALAHLGTVDASLAAARATLAEAAAAVDHGRATGAAGALLAHRVRLVVATAAEDVLRHADHALGPAPLVQDASYAARVADLHLYLRQHHAERDAAALGRLVVEGPSW